MCFPNSFTWWSFNCPEKITSLRRHAKIFLSELDNGVWTKFFFPRFKEVKRLKNNRLITIQGKFTVSMKTQEAKKAIMEAHPTLFWSP